MRWLDVPRPRKFFATTSATVEAAGPFQELAFAKGTLVL